MKFEKWEVGNKDQDFDNWIFSHTGNRETLIARCAGTDLANGKVLAKQIVHEHNTYPSLVAALEKIAKNEMGMGSIVCDENNRPCKDVVEIANKALTLSKEKPC